MSLLSVIIPVHNGSATIRRAVESVVRELPEAEILVVENTSEDDTTPVCEALAAEYPQMWFGHSGKGVSMARNKGIESSKGDWIVFVDADDALADGAGEVIRNAVTDSDADLLLFGHRAGERLRKVTDGDTAERYEGPAGVEDARVRMLQDPTRYMQVWAKAFRGSRLRESGVRFRPELSLSEDSDLIVRYSAVCKEIEFCPQITYLYSVNTPSVMRRYDGSKAVRYVQAMELTAASVENESERIRKAFGTYALMHLNILLVREIFNRSAKASYRERRSEMIRYAQKEVFARHLRELKAGECRSARMLPLLMLRLHRYDAAAAIYMVRAEQNRRREMRGQ
ncbi:MAG: glycosyltransferase [Lachnospiraceae bacterium]|nr:glycosyltransferase [Lachnospiraceae bacterium]